MAARVGLDHEMIMQAAVKLVDEHDLEQLTMATLAAQLNVRTPTLYHYFDGLTGLRRQLSLLGLREVETRVGRAVMGKAGDDAVLPAPGLGHVDQAVRYGEVYGGVDQIETQRDQEAGSGVVDVELYS